MVKRSRSRSLFVVRTMGTVAALVMFSFMAAAPATAATISASWTILIYLDADNDLEEWTFQNMAELESVGSNDEVRILVQIDRHPDYSTADGDWTGARRYEVEQATMPSLDVIHSPVLEDLGEVNMGDPATLVEFLKWGVAWAPAEHYMVLLWDHGGAWDGIAWDDTNGGDRLVLPELDVAFEFARASTGVDRFDIVAMDACLMMTVEVAHTLAPHADILLSSEEVIPEEGFPYADLFGVLKADPDLDPEELADRAVVLFRGRYDGSWRSQAEDPIAFLSWLRLSAEPAFFEATNAFMEEVAAAAPQEWPTLVEQARNSEHFPNPSQEDSLQMDLLDFAVKVGLAYTEGPLRSSVESLLGAARPLVGGTYNPPGHPHATGVSIWFPLPDQEAMPEAPDGVISSVVNATRALWDAASEADTVPPTLEDFSLDRDVIKPDEPVSAMASVSDPHLYDVFAVLTDETDDQGLIVQFLEANYELGEGAGTGGDFEFEWDGNGYALSNETHYVVAPFYPPQPGSPFLILDGTYWRAADETQFPAALVFEKDTGDLVASWDLSQDTAALAPEVGDAFAPEYLALRAAEGENETVLGDWMEASPSGAAWTLYVGAFVEGTYGLAVYASDLAGNDAITDTLYVELKETDAPLSGWQKIFGQPTTEEDDDDTKPAGAMDVFAFVSLAAVAVSVRRRRSP